MAASTSLVVTWHRVSWVIDFARRWTAASWIGVGRSICQFKLYTEYSAGVGPLGVQFITHSVATLSRKDMGKSGGSHLAGRYVG